MRANPLIVTSLTQTCSACPSQWDAKTANEEIYIRYRWGWLRVDNCTTGITIYEAKHGDSLDGSMATDEMKKHTAGIIVWQLE